MSQIDPAQPPLISIVMPAFNAEPYLAETLESIQAQTELRWQCMVVNDGSTDDTARVAQGFCDADSRFSLLNQANSGPSCARNAGFRATDAPFVTFMDADDVYLPHALATLLHRVRSAGSSVGAHGLAELIDAAGIPLDPGSYSARGRSRLGREGKRLVQWPLDRPTTFDVLVNGNVMFPPGLLLSRRSAYEAAGPFDESFRGPEDWDMLIRLSRLGPLQFVDEVILNYRRHGSNLGATSRVSRQAWLVRCKAFYSPENSDEQRRAARLGWRASQRLVGREAAARSVAALRRHDVRTAAKEAARVGVCAIRFVRGWPAPRVRSVPLRW